MFPATENPLLSHPVVKSGCQPHNLLDALSVAAAAKGVVRVVVEGNVEDRAEVEVESEKPEKPAGDVAVAPNE
jgi:hypothetical protein